ncbi:MAG: acyl-CoA dehydratase activase [Desulfomonilaceae bacterium]|nr:acyl-CoA dehydratase activase [Desulfomonilaceae bacterium]
MKWYLGIDCGSVSINLVLMKEGVGEPLTVYRRTRGRPLKEFIAAVEELKAVCGIHPVTAGVLVTGSGRDLLSSALKLPAINEITAHATGAHRVNPHIRTIIEIGGQDSKFITIEPSPGSHIPRVPVFRMNEICAAGTGAFLDEQAERLGLPVESFGSTALQSTTPASIAGRCSVFAKTDMIHQAQEGTPLPDILLGLAFALVRNYVATLVKGESINPLVSLQGGVMSNSAVVYAFRQLLGLSPEQVVIPPHFKVLGALGSAVLAKRYANGSPASLNQLIDRARKAMRVPLTTSCFPPLDGSCRQEPASLKNTAPAESLDPPFVLGLDVGSVSVKGVIVNGRGEIIRREYLLSRSRTFDSVDRVLKALTRDVPTLDAVSVTGSGRHLVGRLLDADVIVDEISAQSKAAMSYSSEVDTVVEIGGQDSKWISLDREGLRDFEMNRVCAAGTGSFLMAQAQRLDLPMGQGFSDAAFSSAAPADLGTKCTVFMESDLVHHQNNGASSHDLAAGVCISIVQNYLERVANNKPLGDRILFLGGVAGNSAVKAAFEQQTGREFCVPEFFTVSGAFGAALKALEQLKTGDTEARRRRRVALERERITSEQFTCKGCTNRCSILKYGVRERTVFQGGLCDRWEQEHRVSAGGNGTDPFAVRISLLDDYVRASPGEGSVVWGMVRSPQFYEWFPFWHGFCRELGISLVVAPRTTRKQFEKGSRFLRVETCLPMKAPAGQIDDLVQSGVQTLFYPSILNEQPPEVGGEPLEHCPYIQASSQFYRGAFDIEWKEPVISFALDSDAFRREHVRFAVDLGFSRTRAADAFREGMKSLADFDARIRQWGAEFLNALDEDDQALVVLGKPYHTSDAFLNMNLGSIFTRLGIRALPSDLYPLSMTSGEPGVYWKHQGRMIQTAAAISQDPRLFPIMITFFGCGPDPFTLRHIRDKLGSKPLLVLEMDEHTSRAGLITRIEAFLERIGRRSESRRKYDNVLTETASLSTAPAAVPVSSPRAAGRDPGTPRGWEGETTGNVRHQKPWEKVRSTRTADTLYLPYMCDHAYGFAAAAQSVGIDAKVLPQPDHESEMLGRPHLVGGECHPYVLILGDYLKLAQTVSPHVAERSLFYILGPSACRLGQYPLYIDKVRKSLGLGIGVIWEVDQGLQAFGLSVRNRQRVFLRAWESLHAYDALLRAFLRIRPRAEAQINIGQVYQGCRDKLFQAVCNGRVRQGMEEVFHDLANVPVIDAEPGPIVSVTGDYYTRVVPFANNDVYREIEKLGATVLPPPTFSDCVKLGALRDVTWGLTNGLSFETARKSFLYGLLAIAEFRVKGSPSIKRAFREPLDLMGRNMWKSAAEHAHTKLPAGITAPIVTALDHIDQGADGLLNLITLNCSYGTVVTAALLRELRKRPGTPMLTLVYDGLKKTNEKTRLEAFMEQVRDHFAFRRGSSPSRRFSVGSA